MKKYVIIVLLIILISGVVSCAKLRSSPYIVNTYEKTPTDQINQLIDSESIIRKTYYELSDGTWKTEGHIYKYKLVISGRLHSAVKDNTYVILSNRNDITFDEAWKASGLSSNTNDYFKPEDAIIVEVSIS